MNGLTPNLAMITPFASPTATPAAMPATHLPPRPNFTIDHGGNASRQATVDPTERSKPPPIITNVMPIAITAMIEDCTSILVRLSGEKK